MNKFCETTAGGEGLSLCSIRIEEDCSNQFFVCVVNSEVTKKKISAQGLVDRM